MDDIESGHLQELRRGTVVLACLLILRAPDYGYALLERLAAAGLAVDGNTLYPLLRRLEKQELLTSEWNTDEARPRKFYRTSAAGETLAARLLQDWSDLTRTLTTSITETRNDHASTLTDRYVWAVLRSLPEAQRADIDRELRATIADTVDAKIESGSKPADAEREALIELGDPYKLAWGYADRPLHLIGPALFPDYIRLLRVLYFIVLPIVVVVVFLSLLLAKSLEGESPWGAFGPIWPIAIGVAVHMGFWTTLVFAVLERTHAAGQAAHEVGSGDAAAARRSRGRSDPSTPAPRWSG